MSRFAGKSTGASLYRRAPCAIRKTNLVRLLFGPPSARQLSPRGCSAFEIPRETHAAKFRLGSASQSNGSAATTVVNCHTRVSYRRCFGLRTIAIACTSRLLRGQGTIVPHPRTYFTGKWPNIGDPWRCSARNLVKLQYILGLAEIHVFMKEAIHQPPT